MKKIIVIFSDCCFSISSTFAEGAKKWAHFLLGISGKVSGKDAQDKDWSAGLEFRLRTYFGPFVLL